MDLAEALCSNPSVREFTDEPVSDEEVAALLEVARFAPSGGNRQPWRVAVIKEPSLRRALADLCGPVWSEYLAEGITGATPFSVVGPPPEIEPLGPQPNPLLDAIESVPVVLVVAADLGQIAMMDKDLARVPLTGGASVYPFVHSILLAARDRNLGGVMTTFLARAEPAAAPLMRLPDTWALASMVFLGHPVRRATKLTRRPVSDFAVIDRFDGVSFG
ncbi:MAG: nitroreductase family protein [Acidimicrobiia bacterium]|nr:nitroreductase family protein [Acidimicrobiia bacterium]